MPNLTASRWLQLCLGILCMIMIANLQYGWTLFVLPIEHAQHWKKAEIQLAFTIFVLCETWLLPFEGYLIDRIGPRPTVAAGGLLIGAAWVVNGLAGTLPALYLGAALGGTGAGFVYGATVGNALRWFPDRRGLAAGLTAAGFGAGSAFTIIPIANMIAGRGYQDTFITFGLIQGAVVLVVAWFLRAPPGAAPAHAEALSPSGMSAMRPSRLHEVTKDYGPAGIAAQPVFWVMYLMFVLVGAGGLIATAQLSVIATDFGVAKTPVSLGLFTLPALTLALSLDRIMNGITRPFFGWVSDKIGRENTMFIAFLAEGLGILSLLFVAGNPVAVPGDLRRHVRQKIRRRQLRAALHRQGHGRPAGAHRQHPARRYRQLARGDLRRRRRQHRRRAAGAAGAAPAAAAFHRPLDGRKSRRAECDRPRPDAGRRWRDPLNLH
jgi:OFA family oxalate/formate antiporter-like MFS transporter